MPVDLVTIAVPPLLWLFVVLFLHVNRTAAAMPPTNQSLRTQQLNLNIGA